jgi:DNA-binding PadR family transcriptional regulator
LRSRKHRGRFWRRWQEYQSSEGQSQETEADPRNAWHQHFTNFLGTVPEEHWLFGGRRFRSWASGEWGPPGLFNPFVALVLSKGGGLLALYVLHLLAEKPRYGNDIMHEIEERTDRRWGSNPGAIYPMLSIMEDTGLVEGEWEDPDKRTRRIYSLTSEGREELGRLKEVMRPKLEEAITILQDLYKDLEDDEK